MIICTAIGILSVMKRESTREHVEKTMTGIELVLEQPG